MEEDVKLTAGQEVIVTVLDTKAEAKKKYSSTFRIFHEKKIGLKFLSNCGNIPIWNP
ncbi:MAG: hypothetical protein NC124_15305 [Clostridium sp.]|nr:hypothetical protein [Clostridium sp.]